MMGEQEKKTVIARKVIEASRGTVALNTLLDPGLKNTAETTFDFILSHLDDGSLSVDDALDLTGSLMDAILVQTQHAAFQAKSLDARSRSGQGAATARLELAR